MDPVNVLVWVIVAVVFLFFLFQARFWSRIFGIEYFEELYTFQNPLKASSIRDLFTSLELVKYQKNVFYYIDLKRFYSIGHEGLDDWSSWIPLEDKPNLLMIMIFVLKMLGLSLFMVMICIVLFIMMILHCFMRVKYIQRLDL